MIHSLIEPLEARIAPASLTITAPTSAIVEGSADHQVTFTVTLDAASATPVTVHYSTADGTQPSPLDNAMVSDGDYAATTGTLTFNPGVLTQTFNVTIHGDTKFEHNEVFTASLDTPTGGASLGVAQVTATILNDDPRPTLSIASTTMVEGNDLAHPNQLVFTVTLSNASSDTIVATASTADGTAMASDNDYTPTTATLTFNPGETSKTFSVPVTPDTKSENDETVLANLAITSSNAVPGTVQATGTILNDDAILSITDAQAVEGALGSTTNLAFPVSLDTALPGQVVSVDYTTMDGTAVTTGTIAAGTRDYEPTHGTLMLTADASGHATATVMVPVNGDGVPEADETLNLNLGNAKIINADNTTSPIVFSKGTGVSTITNDDPNLSITGGSVVEGNLGDPAAKTITFNVTLNAAAPGQIVHVDYATMDGTAVSTGTGTAGTSDYISQSGTLTLTADANGHATMPVTVQVNGDGVVENTETFNVVLSNADGGVPILNGTAVGTITDNDTNMLTISDVTVVEGDAGHKDAVFVVSLTPAATGTVTVHYATVEGTAVSTGPRPDYTAESGTLTFTAGTTAQTIIVPILGDLVHEATEMFTVKLSGVSANASIANDTGTGTITDNDPIPTITLAPASVTEGNVGDTHQLAFVATLSAPSQDAVTVDFATADGTATVADNDYGAKAGTISFAIGATTQTVFIDVTGDTKNEGNETMSVNLSNAQGATLATTTATGTILNDDITASIANATFTEGDVNTPGTMTVTLSDAPLPGSTAVVNFALTGDSAGVGTDVQLHDPTITSLTFNAGETTKTINLDIIGDTTNEADESFTVTLTSATGAVVDQTHAVGIGTIHDNDPLPTVSIGNAQVTEDDSGTSAMTFTVSLSAASGQTVMVNAATLDGTAHAGSDYTALAGQVLTFQPGQTTQTVSVPIIGDTTDEQTETFQVQLSSPTNATVDPLHGAGTGTILDNDLRALSISDASIAEGNLGDTHQLTFTVSIPTAAAQDITVHYDTFDGTAKAGTDYVAKTDGVVTILHGQTSATITVDVDGNNIPQANRSLVVKLRDPINATLGDAQGIGTIVDDEASYQLVKVLDQNVEDDATTTPKTVIYNVVRSGDAAALAVPGSVTFTTVDGTGPNGAIAGSDYIAKSGTLNFTAGQTEHTITVDLRKDLAHENTETFQVELTGSNSGVLRDDNGAIQTTLAKTATILDNDPLPTITINSPSVTEGNPGDPGETDLTFVVSLSAADQTQDVTVSYMTLDGTGENGAISTPNGSRAADFTAIGPTTLTIPAGSLSASFVVHVNRDTVSEGDETFTVQLSNPTGGETFAAGGDTGTGTIKNDDAGPTISFAGANNGNLSLFEGNTGATTPATFTVQLSAASEQTVTVDVGLGAGTATAGTDFTDTNVPKTLTFAPGETSKTFSYSILGDDQNEADETFSVVLSNAKNATLSTATPQATVKIKNDDPLPALAIDSVSQPEGDSGTTDMIFTVTLTGQSDHAVTVDYATSDAGAVSSGPSPDYQTVHGTLTFAPGETTKTIMVPINGDTIKEIDETFAVTLSNASSNAMIAQHLGGGTILNDGDTTIGISILDSKVAEGDSGTKNASFNVQLSAASAVPVTVDIATRDDTAVAGSDYTAVHTTLTFSPGTVVQTVTVPIIGDTVFEATESYFIDGSNVTGGAQLLGSGEGRGTIYNDDIQIVNAHTVRYVDADGDLATVHITKGTLTTSGQNRVLNFSAVNAIGGRTLQRIDFTGDRLGFNHTDLSVTADVQPGFSASGGTSDGRVDVGYIEGGIVQDSLLQIFNNIDFGNVTVEGDLGKIVAGDQVATDRAIKTLSILSEGAKGGNTGAPDNVSIFLGGARRISVEGDWNGALESIGGDTGDIESLTIKGALQGGFTAGSGQIVVTGILKNAIIGSIIGGSGEASGTIIGNFTNDATLTSGSSIGTVHVLGDVVGGAGDDSGGIFAPNVSAAIIDSDLTGGSGGSSGVIQVGIPSFGGSLGKALIKGDVLGGTGANSGEVSATKNIGTVVVDGSLLGGAGADSGSIVSGGRASTVKVLKNIVGDAGERSGSVQTTQNLAKFQLGTIHSGADGNLEGGKGASSGLLLVGLNLTKAGVIYGNIEGGVGSSSGGVNTKGRLVNFTVDGDIIGGSTDLLAVTVINTSGYILANQIGSLAIVGDIKSGIKAAPNQDVEASGTIRVVGEIGSMMVNNIVGNSDVPVVIAAAGTATAARNRTIGALTVNGNSDFADILGGYGGDVSSTNLLGNPLNPDAQMGTIKILGSVEATNIVAGIGAGNDERFGTDDDEVITGGSADNPALRSRIAAVILKGTVKPNADVFGVVAQIIGTATVGNMPLQLNSTRLDKIELGTGTTNFFLNEVGLS